jgi:uncharacterized SAM-binding protein YcdF (DUF218 family)
MRRRTIAGLSVAGLVLAAMGWALFGLGHWLIYTDAVTRTDAIAVLNGQLPFRAMEAAALYGEGAAPEVWLLKNDRHPEDLALERLGIAYPQEWAYSRMVLVKQGVPEGAIRVLESEVHTTREEVAYLRAELERRKLAAVAIVTSKQHTRRVRILWDTTVGGGLRAVVRPARLDTYEPSRWWRTSGDALATVREIGGILNAWARFPVASRKESP